MQIIQRLVRLLRSKENSRKAATARNEAEHLAWQERRRELHETAAAKLVLLTRSALPPATQWAELHRTLGSDHAKAQPLKRLKLSGCC